MSFKVVFFAVAVLACQANAQTGFIRPILTGYANGVAELAKPFVQWGQSLVSPAADYFASVRPQASQWMSFGQRPLAQAQAAAYEGYEALTSALPTGANVLQMVRPGSIQPEMISVAAQNMIKPIRPYPISVPTAEVSGSASLSGSTSASTPSLSSLPSLKDAEEAAAQFVPSSLLPQESTADFAVEVPTGGKVPMTLEAKDVPVLSFLGKQ